MPFVGALGNPGSFKLITSVRLATSSDSRLLRPARPVELIALTKSPGKYTIHVMLGRVQYLPAMSSTTIYSDVQGLCCLILRNVP